MNRVVNFFYFLVILSIYFTPSLIFEIKYKKSEEKTKLESRIVHQETVSNTGDRAVVLYPQKNQIFLEGEISFSWRRPEGDKSVYRIAIKKNNQEVYTRKTTGTRRTKYLRPGEYEFALIQNEKINERIAFKVVPRGVHFGKSHKEVSALKLAPIDSELKSEEVDVSAASERTKEEAQINQGISTTSQVISEHPAWVSLGIGFHLFGFNQENSTLQARTQYSSLSGPSYGLGAGIHYSPRSLLEISYQVLPVEIKGASSTLVSSNKTQWKSLEVTNRFEYSTNYSILLGAKAYELPWLSAKTDGSFESLNLSTFSLSGGLGYVSEEYNRVTFESKIMYEVPVFASSNTGGLFSASNYTTFNGSLEAHYKFHKDTSVGIVWFGQYHKFKYSYDDKAGNISTGAQMMIYSEVQLALRQRF